jgi:hypothetical protein
MDVVVVLKHEVSRVSRGLVASSSSLELLGLISVSILEPCSSEFIKIQFRFSVHNLILSLFLF